MTPVDDVKVEGRVALVRRGGGKAIRLSANREIRLEKSPRGNLSFTPVAGLLTAALSIESDGEPVTAELSVVEK